MNERIFAVMGEKAGTQIASVAAHLQGQSRIRSQCDPNVLGCPCT